MDNQHQQCKFELPKSPASTLNGEHEDNDYDDVQFVRSYVLEPEQGNCSTKLTSNALMRTFVPSTNLMPMSTFVATPPQSPLEVSQQQPDMPYLSALLANNYNSYISMGYIVNIPCYLCKQPFTNINSLRDHLTSHAEEIKMINLRLLAGSMGTPQAALGGNHAVNLPSSVIEKNAMPMMATPTVAESSNSFEMPANYSAIPFEFCGGVLPSKQQLTLHCVRQHTQNRTKERDKQTLMSFKCVLCKRNYKLFGNLVNHMNTKHPESPLTAATNQSTPHSDAGPIKVEKKAPIPNTPQHQMNVPSAVVSSQMPTNNNQDERVVWTTKLLNAVSAANYNPSKESVAKYMPPTVEKQGSLKPAKRKYAPRSPYFNPNIWLDSQTYVP